PWSASGTLSTPCTTSASKALPSSSNSSTLSESASAELERPCKLPDWPPDLGPNPLGSNFTGASARLLPRALRFFGAGFFLGAAFLGAAAFFITAFFFGAFFGLALIFCFCFFLCAICAVYHRFAFSLQPTLILTGVHLRQARSCAILVYRGAYACHSAPSRDRKTAYEAGPAHRANQEFLCARSHPAAPRGSRRHLSC